MDPHVLPHALVQEAEHEGLENRHGSEPSELAARNGLCHARVRRDGGAARPHLLPGHHGQTGAAATRAWPGVAFPTRFFTTRILKRH